jgi:hypothetical protein
MSNDSTLDVFGYSDYREFLRALYAERKARGLSYRWLARRAALSSASFLKAVIDGHCALGAGHSERACDFDGIVQCFSARPVEEGRVSARS